MSDEMFNKAVQSIRSGELYTGRMILLKLLKQDSRNELAWFWLAKTYKSNQRTYCLEKVLEINPQNSIAREYINKQDSQKLREQQTQKTEEDARHIYEEQKHKLDRAGCTLRYMKYRQSDGTLLFKPTTESILRSKVLPMGLVFVSQVIMFIIFGTLLIGEFSFFFVFSAFTFLFFLVGAYFITSIISWYHVSLTTTDIEGPRSMSNPYWKNKMPIQSVDLASSSKKNNLLGNYILRSNGEGNIVLSGFDMETIQDLTNLIAEMQSSK